MFQITSFSLIEGSRGSGVRLPMGGLRRPDGWIKETTCKMYGEENLRILLGYSNHSTHYNNDEIFTDLPLLSCSRYWVVLRPRGYTCSTTETDWYSFGFILG